MPTARASPTPTTPAIACGRVADSQTGTILLDYDDLDRLTSETTLQGVITYGYDAADRRTSMTVTGQTPVIYAYDDADRLTSITQGSTVVGFEYDSANRRTALVLPNGVRVEYGYTSASEVAGLTYTLGQTVLGTLNYTYDAAGRRTAMTGSWARTLLPAELGAASYNAANRLTQWDGATLTYDANGNLLSDGARTYSWDVRNRLSAIGGATPATFQYEALGRRTSKSTVAGTKEYLHDGIEPVQASASTRLRRAPIRMTGIATVYRGESRLATGALGGRRGTRTCTKPWPRRSSTSSG